MLMVFLLMGEAKGEEAGTVAFVGLRPEEYVIVVGDIVNFRQQGQAGGKI
jgi:hypothetical protein